jgi:hypothetical protein
MTRSVSSLENSRSQCGHRTWFIAQDPEDTAGKSLPDHTVLGSWTSHQENSKVSPTRERKRATLLGWNGQMGFLGCLLGQPWYEPFQSEGRHLLTLHTLGGPSLCRHRQEAWSQPTPLSPPGPRLLMAGQRELPTLGAEGSWQGTSGPSVWYPTVPGYWGRAGPGPGSGKALAALSPWRLEEQRWQPNLTSWPHACPSLPGSHSDLHSVLARCRGSVSPL